ncbi:hypothetical protein [Roseibacillus persicicus]|uniref:hypothetical protein n=1 Tax=Roseibacillus persicicus TaxID=454148 RepID=UPI0028101DFA|nr:hypothetical protein [Roseibacillus persicicus]MDQ8189771.1 hypothetical protein [Roseibacillus persicicus]
MRNFAITLLLLTSLSPHSPAERELIFSDDFERNESQEEKEEIGRGWTTASETRAQGNKQVDLKDGTMRIFLHPVADHAVSVRQAMNLRDGAVGMKFKLENPKDELGINFADLKEKSVWAGHLFKVVINEKSVSVTDLKTGVMNLTIRDARRADKLSPEQEEVLKKASQRFTHRSETNEWHDLLIEIKGEAITVTIDGQEVATFSSAGIAHPTKTLLRLSVPHQAVVDEVKIWRDL